jgi:hypothetical protein
MTLMGWFCVALTAGYLITNHIVLPLYTDPLDYYWNQWNEGARGIVQVDEAKVTNVKHAPYVPADPVEVLPWSRHHQLVRRYLHPDRTHL